MCAFGVIRASPREAGGGRWPQAGGVMSRSNAALPTPPPLRGTSPAKLGRRKNSLNRHEAQREAVVGRLDQVDVLARRPHDRLLVQRDVGEIVDIELGRLGDLGVALGLVGLLLHLV